MVERELEVLLKQYDPLFHKVLLRSSIFQRNPEYDDYLQVMKEQFWLYADQFETQAVFEKEHSLTYLYQMLYWKVRDYQRKQLREESVVEEVKKYQPLAPSQEDGDQQTWVLLMQDVWFQLRPEEQALLEALWLREWSVQEVAKFLKVSRTTVYKWLAKVQNKINLWLG